MLYQKNIQQIYFFNKVFKYYINLSLNLFILYFKYHFFFLKLPCIYFFNKQKLINNGINFRFIFFKKFLYISFLRHFFCNYNRLFSFYYFRLKLKGLGYRIYKVSKFLIKIFFNRNNFFYLHIPVCILNKYRTRRLFFLSLNYNKLRLFIINLLLLKKFLSYKIIGLIYPYKIILMKPGKNKF